MNIIRAEEYIYSIPHGGLTKSLGTSAQQRHTPLVPSFLSKNIPLMISKSSVFFSSTSQFRWKNFASKNRASVEPS